MAIIEAISSKANIKRIIRYVTQDKKTNVNLISGKDCMAESCLEEMLYTKNLYHKNSGRQYIHIIQSFDPKDNLSMENEFRRIEKEQSNSTRKSSSSINNKDGLLSNRTRDNKGFISNGTSNGRRYNNYEKESTRYTGKVIKGQYSNERGNEKIGRGKIERSILQLEARIERNGRGTEKQDFQNKMENRVNNILGGIIAISNMVYNSQVNNRPKRRIRRYRTLSKQAMKEYAMRKANSSGFDWFEDEEEM